MRHALVIDIETVPSVEFEDLPAEQQKYLLARPSPLGQLSQRESADKQLNMTPIYGKIVTIALWLASEDRGACLLEGDDNEWRDDLNIASQCFVGTEQEMLTNFWKIVEKYSGQVITWNGRGFDIPFLYLRSAIHGVKPTRNIMGTRYRTELHCDLFEIVNFHGATRIGSYSLESYCHAFGVQKQPSLVPSPGEVPELYRAGELHNIAKHCMSDVAATHALFLKLRDLVTLLHQ